MHYVIVLKSLAALFTTTSTIDGNKNYIIDRKKFQLLFRILSLERVEI